MCIHKIDTKNNNMTDIFDTKILCKKDGNEMRQTIVERNGMQLRAVKCHKCGDTIVHPADLNGLENFNDLKDKKFNVKLRMVGNSHAISIPKEIIDFMSDRQRELHKQMNDIVRLSFDDFDTLKMSFFDDHDQMQKMDENQDSDFDDGDRKVRRRVHDDGNGNIDVVETQSLNDGTNGIRRIRIKKIRRYNGDKE